MPQGCEWRHDYDFIRDNEAIFTLFFMALRDIAKKWTMPIRDWKAALNRFTILFEDRMPVW